MLQYQLKGQRISIKAIQFCVNSQPLKSLLYVVLQQFMRFMINNDERIAQSESWTKYWKERISGMLTCRYSRCNKSLPHLVMHQGLETNLEMNYVSEIIG